MSKKIYDLLVIGGGIAGSVFASNFLKNNFKGRIGLIEAGRRLGGRSSTRLSSRFSGWQLNHGSPYFNICNNSKNEQLDNYINQLLNNNIIQLDDSDFLILNKFHEINLVKDSPFLMGNNYSSTGSMTDFSEKIIELNNLRNQIDFYFQTLIIKLDFKNDHWTLISKNGQIFQSKFIICSSNLLLHKRSMVILNTHQIPLRSSVPKNNNKVIDSILNVLNKQSYIPRISFLIYTKSSYEYKDKYSKKYRYFILDNYLENIYKFERIIFQRQKDMSLGIVIHSKNTRLISEFLNKKKENKLKREIILKFNKLFEGNPYINNLSVYQGISIMHWRASQPIGAGVPESLQYCQEYKIGFCGDWFEGEGFGRVEGAILSALKLSSKFKY